MKKHEQRQKTALQQELQKGLQEEIDTQREMNRLYVEDWKAEQERRKKMPREIRIRESIRSVAVIVTILLTFHLLGLSSNLQGDSETRVLTLTFLLPLFFTSCVYGFVTGISCYGVIFLLQFIYNPDTAYTATLLMVTVLLGSYGVAQGFFRTKKRMLCYFLILCVMIGSLYYFLYGLIARKTFDDFSLIGGLLGMTLILPQLLFGCIVVYLFYRHLPENLIPYFPERGFYRAEQEVTSVWETIRKHRYRVSGKLMTIIVSEAIFLGMMTVTFANFLIPNMNIISTGSAESTEEVQVNKDLLKQWETLFNSSMGVENGEVSLDKASDQTNLIMDLNFWVFDIKLMLMLLNLIVPLTVIANLIAQRIFAKPIIEMNTALEKYSQEEEISKYVEKIDALEIHTHDEIEDLYHSLYNMVHQINDSVEKFKEDQQLREDLRVAKASSEAKGNFLSNMSHEIRTPINAVLGFDEMILRESRDENITEYAANIQSSGKTLLSLVNDILDSSKIESGKMEILPVEYDLSSVVNDLLHMIQPKADAKDLEVKVEVDATMPTLLFGDEIRIKQCILNILTNAVKYTEQGSVLLKVGYEKIDEKQIAFKVLVKDTGIGIKEEDLKKLFSPFERIEESRNRTIEGTGLGMSIVKNLLALMDSQLHVESVYGEGSEFSFTVTQGVVNWNQIGDFAETYKKNLKKIEKYQESFRAPNAKILVTDDTAMNLTVIKGLLKPTQIRIDTAASGMETLEKIKDVTYDVILLDHRMPKMDGIETLQAMKQDTTHLNTGTPVIALTANAVSGAREIYMEAGFTDYLTKPINPEKLEAMLRFYLPEEKLEDVPADDAAGAEAGTVAGAEAGTVAGTETGAADPQAQELAQLKHCEGIDYEAAIANCMNEEILLQAAKDFRASIEGSAAQIETYLEEGNYREYTVLVHGLKSSARLIGANELSADAAYLEQCGNEVNVGEMQAKTPKLVADYRAYLARLSFLEETHKEELPPIDPGQLSEMCAAIRELGDAFDFRSAEEIVAMWDDYALPESEKERCKAIREAVHAADREALLQLF